MQEDLTTCKSGTPTVDGSKSSNMKGNTLSMSRTERHLMFLEVRIEKVKMSSSGRNITDLIRDGRSSTLTRLRKNKIQV
jgi:hypothetical protein